MKYKYKFSVIIPIYNVELYLRETIDSVINQTIGFEDNIEIILVNDGSPDNSEKICLEYVEKYPNNIKYIKQDNAGVSAARNNGYSYAEGEFINFLDSDDKWEEDSFEKIYDFFTTHSGEIDVVACKLKYFEARNDMSHPLNYKFKEDTVIDVREQESAVQMHAVSCVVRKNAVDELFNPKLKYAEDSLFINKIILKKMKFGALESTHYLYRKRKNETSAIDTAYSNINYYDNVLTYFHDELFEYSKALYGEVVPYVQNVSMYDLQWRLKREANKNILSDDEIQTYINHLAKILKEIDDKVILGARYIFSEHKTYALSLKYGKNIFDIADYNDGVFSYMDNHIYSLHNSGLLTIDVLNIHNSKLQVAGRVNTLIGKDKYKVYAEVNGKRELLDFNEFDYFKKRCTKGILYSDKAFVREWEIKNDETRIKFFIEYKGDVIQIFPRFNRNGRLNEKLSLHYDKGKFTVFLDSGIIIVRKKMLIKSINLDLKNLFKMLKKKKYKQLIMRIMVKTLKLFKRHEIWLICDRVNVANDNGMHLFKYINSLKERKERVYFVIDKDTDDFAELKKIGNVIPYGSLKYKLYFMLADKLISSQIDNWVVNPFGKSESFYRDLYVFDLIFLQHGITQNDISEWLNIYSKNISLFVTSANKEYEAILNGDYGYTKDVVKLTGMPRYDNLIDAGEKIISIMPTWRQGLSGPLDKRTGIRAYNPDFKQSEYFKYYNSLINDKRIISAMKEAGYKGIFVIHPSHMENYIDFEKNDVFDIINGFADYQDIFKKSSVLITDYSSVAFDFAYLKKPVIYTQFDKEEFFSKHILKEGYFKYDIDGFGPAVYDYESAVNEILKYIKNECKIEQKYKKRIDDFYKYHDNQNAKRVYEEIKKLK